MRNRYCKVLGLLLLLAACLPQDTYAIWPFKKKKKEEKKEVLTPYQKLFKGKKVQTAHGLMTLHKVEDKVYVEFPVAMLGRELLFTSSIENTSDGGEGAPGQFGGTDVRLLFEMIDSTVVARMPLLSKPVNSAGDADIACALNRSHHPGIFKSFKVLACTPDSSAVVINMKNLFLEGSAYTKPFPSNSANGFYGFVSRDHTLQADKSAILGVSATQNNVTVREEVVYKVDHTLMGAYSMYENVPLTAVVNKMLCALPDTPMQPRLADSRLGMSSLSKSNYAAAGKEVQSVRYAKRWRIEPSDSAAYRRGEQVEPKKTLVFYIDSLMPARWHSYIKAGAESWNRAFEKIGFKNVIAVKEFPTDTSFRANNFDVMTIRYSASWMNSAQTIVHADTRTGEILNASILLNANLISVQNADRISATMASDPRVRTSVLPEDIQGELIQAAVAEAVGTGLGLTVNWYASQAYPVDSLRSADFTRRYGLASSVMGGVVINDVATAEDVRKGVRLVNTNPGPYDELLVKYLYKPTFASSPEEEKKVLDGWIREHMGDPAYTYVRSQRFESDPRNIRGGLGDDHIKSFDYALRNIRIGLDNYYTWYAEGDRDMYYRERAYAGLYDKLRSRMFAVLSYIGGIYLNDIRQDDALPSYSMVDKEIQKAAMEKVLSLGKDLSWLEEAAHATSFTVVDKKVNALRLDIFNGIFARLPYIEVCTEYFPDKAYTVSEYLDAVYNIVWEGTLKRRPLDNMEKALQTSFLESVVATSTVTSPIGSFKSSPSSFADVRLPKKAELMALREGKEVEHGMRWLQKQEEVAGFTAIPTVHTNQTKVAAYYFDLLMRTKEMLEKSISAMPEADRSHYELLIYRINKAVEIK